MPLLTAPRSINARVVLAALAVVLLFLLLAGLSLDRAFRENARAGREEWLLSALFMLMGSAELDQQGRIVLPRQLPEPRFSLPGSGLYANIADVTANTEWQSASSLGFRVPFERALTPGERVFGERVNFRGHRYWVAGHGIKWSIGPTSVALTFSVAEDLTAYQAQLNHYRRTLWGWLAALGTGLLASMVLLLRWGLRPLRLVAQEVAKVQSGRVQQFSRDYPDEIRLLTSNLNHLLQRDREQMQRYRNALADLAHSLKTPLAVLQASASDPRLLAQHLPEQLDRMNHIIAYQLQRASTAGSARFAAPVVLQPVLEKTLASLRKVHAGKPLALHSDVDPQASWKIDEGDLYELLGNLLDNACKWCRQEVSVRMAIADGQLTIRVEDDGPGISDPDAILLRGVRADEQVAGHGIGLAMVRDIVEAYGGSLTVGRAAQGGAQINLVLPSWPSPAAGQT